MKLCRNKKLGKNTIGKRWGGEKQGKEGGREKEIQMMNLCLKKTFPLKKRSISEHIESLKHQRQMIKQWNDKNEMKREGY